MRSVNIVLRTLNLFSANIMDKTELVNYLKEYFDELIEQEQFADYQSCLNYLLGLINKQNNY